MPELPEVEIVRQSLHKKIKKKSIKKVIIRNRNLRFKIPSDFESFLKNKKIIEVSRFSKYLIIHFQNEDYCLIHLGMSGTIHILDKKKPLKFTNTSFYHSPFLPKKHNHAEFIFDSLKVIYNDPRRFGFFEIINNYQDLQKRFKSMGPEPFSDKFNLNYVVNYFKKKNKDIKSFLLDQRFVSGIGNIYASEILFASKINPFKKAKRLNKNECLNIIFNSKKILQQAINKGGSSIRDFKDISGNKGTFQKEFKVYQQDGADCSRTNCKGIIKKKITSNRSTFFLCFLSKIVKYLVDHYKFSSYTPAQMANTKSAIKRIRRISKQTAVNKARKSRFRNALKKMNLLIDGKKKDEALKFLPKLNSELMKIAKTGIIKKQNASRNVSRITKKIAAI